MIRLTDRRVRSEFAIRLQVAVLATAITVFTGCASPTASDVSKRPVTAFGQTYNCGVNVPEDICNELVYAAQRLSESTYPECQQAGDMLVDRLINPELLVYDGNDYENVMYVLDNNETLFVTPNTLYGQFPYGQLGKVITHELVGHIWNNYSDAYMQSINYGQRCNYL